MRKKKLQKEAKGETPENKHKWAHDKTQINTER